MCWSASTSAASATVSSGDTVITGLVMIASRACYPASPSSSRAVKDCSVEGRQSAPGDLDFGKRVRSCSKAESQLRCKVTMPERRAFHRDVERHSACRSDWSGGPEPRVLAEPRSARGMHMPKTLIVPVDGSDASERAMRVALELVTHLDRCALLIMTAVRTGRPRSPRYWKPSSVKRPCLVCAESSSKTQFPLVQVIGHLAESISDATVCMATHGRGRIAAPLLGSVATAVLRQSTTPVLLVGPHCETVWWHSPAKLVACWVDAGSNALLAWSPQWADDLGAEFWLESVFHRLDTHMAADPHAEFAPASRRLGPTSRSTCCQSATITRQERSSRVPVPSRDGARHDDPRTHRDCCARAGSVAMDVVHRSPCPVLVAHA